MKKNHDRGSKKKSVCGFRIIAEKKNCASIKLIMMEMDVFSCDGDIHERYDDIPSNSMQELNNSRIINLPNMM